MTTPAPPESATPQRRALWLRSAITMAVIIAGLFLIEVVDWAIDYPLDSAGIIPRSTDGLDGILFAPMLHVDFAHLIANVIPGAVLGFLLLLSRRFLVVTAAVWLISGFGVWLISPSNTITVGASGIVFGWLTYLLVRGLFNRDVWQILIGIVLFVLYGGILWGMLPSDGSVSWQAHLCGAIGGVFIAWALAERDRRKRVTAAGPGGAPVGRLEGGL